MRPAPDRMHRRRHSGLPNPVEAVRHISGSDHGPCKVNNRDREQQRQHDPVHEIPAELLLPKNSSLHRVHAAKRQQLKILPSLIRYPLTR